MTKKKESASIPSENPDLCSTTEITGMSAPSIYRAANGATIDFHSAEFNQTDDLNDMFRKLPILRAPRRHCHVRHAASDGAPARGVLRRCPCI